MARSGSWRPTSCTSEKPSAWRREAEAHSECQWLTPMAAIRRTMSFRRSRARPSSERQRDDRALVLPRAHLAFGKDSALGDPSERVLEHFLRVWLEDDPLTRSPAAGVHDVVEACGEFVLVIVRVELGTD